MEEITAVHDADYIQQLKDTAENKAPMVVADFDDPDGFTYMTSTSFDDAVKVILACWRTLSQAWQLSCRPCMHCIDLVQQVTHRWAHQHDQHTGTTPGKQAFSCTHRITMLCYFMQSRPKYWSTAYIELHSCGPASLLQKVAETMPKTLLQSMPAMSRHQVQH